MLSQTSRYTCLLLFALCLGACGFQLRGTGNSATALPDDWKQLFLITANPNGEFGRELVARFEANGVNWTEREQANYMVLVSGERFEQRNLSLTAEARAAEFELTMSATFAVQTVDGGAVIDETVASVFKQMENDPRNVVGKAEEIRLLKNEMRAELAQQIMQRIGFFAASTQADPAGSS